MRQVVEQLGMALGFDRATKAEIVRLACRKYGCRPEDDGSRLLRDIRISLECQGEYEAEGRRTFARPVRPSGHGPGRSKRQLVGAGPIRLDQDQYR